MSDKTINYAAPQVIKPEHTGIYRSTPYQFVSTGVKTSTVVSVGSVHTVGTVITKKPFAAPVRKSR